MFSRRAPGRISVRWYYVIALAWLRSFSAEAASNPISPDLDLPPDFEQRIADRQTIDLYHRAAYESEVVYGSRSIPLKATSRKSSSPHPLQIIRLETARPPMPFEVPVLPAFKAPIFETNLVSASLLP